jgi:hypothetical protein
MKTWYLWVGLALLALLLLTIREGFPATATIKNPTGWDAAEITRIKNMMNPPSTLTDAEIREVVGGFWAYTVPGRLPGDAAVSKGWSVATSRIPGSDVTEYVDGVIRAKPEYSSKRSQFVSLIQSYYINQGASEFTAATGYSASVEGVNPPPPPAEEEETPTEVERPTTATDSLRREIATTFGIPLTDTTNIDGIISLIQSFYDQVYVANDKAPPTYSQIMGYADTVDVSLLPASVKNNFKPRFVEVVETYFARASGTSVSAGSGGGASAGAADFSSAGGTDPVGAASGRGKNVYGPDSGGTGSTDNTTGGLGIPRNYPVLYGGLQSYESAIPSSSSLGTDPTSRFLPYSRVPGDMDLYPDPYRLGKYFSTSSYSSGKDAVEPAPFLADFSKFFT